MSLKLPSAICEEYMDKRITPYWMAFEVCCDGCRFDKDIKGGRCKQFDPPVYVFSIPPRNCPKRRWDFYFNTDWYKEFFIEKKGDK